MAPKTKNVEIGQRLAAARMQRGLSQGTVARLAGIAPSYLSRIENAKVHPTFRTVQKISTALRVSLDEITGPMKDHGHTDGNCPISTSGACMLDLIRSDAQVKKVASGEVYSAREVRLLQRMAEWMRDAGSERLRAMEILLDDMTRGRAGATKSPPAESRRRR